jgi:hypothetical protein
MRKNNSGHTMHTMLPEAWSLKAGGHSAQAQILTGKILLLRYLATGTLWR